MQNQYWLPEKVNVTFDVPEAPILDMPPGMQPPQEQTQRRSQARKGTVSVVYSDYQVNVGLSDEIFQKTKPK